MATTVQTFDPKTYTPSKAMAKVIEAQKQATTELSPLQRNLKAQKTEAAKKVSYFETEDWLRMKAFAIRARIVMYQNLGMAQEYAAAQAEGADVVKKYQALLAKASAQKGADEMAKQINEKLGLDVSA